MSLVPVSHARVPELPNHAFCAACLARGVRVPLVRCTGQDAACPSCDGKLTELSRDTDKEGYLVVCYVCLNKRLDAQGRGHECQTGQQRFDPVRVSVDWGCVTCGQIVSQWVRGDQLSGVPMK